MKYGLLLAVVALAAVYLLRGDLPGDWFGAGGGSLSAPTGSINSLDGALGGAIKRTADQF
jgi:hypothetical protein